MTHVDTARPASEIVNDPIWAERFREMEEREAQLEGRVDPNAPLPRIAQGVVKLFRR